jgi:hypothetical protein
MRWVSAQKYYVLARDQGLRQCGLVREVLVQGSDGGAGALGLSPHISAGGTLGVEDVRVLTQAVRQQETLAAALSKYEANRIPHYARVHELADAVEGARDAREYAHEYAKFTHWMLNEGYRASRT